jgi:serine/threonine protein kinase/Leucine-rich repeat (LRR) protein
MLGTCYAHAAAQLALHAWRRSGTLHVPAYGDRMHTIVTAHGCSGQDPLAAIATLSGFTRDLGPDGLPTLTCTPMGISGTEHANTIDDSPLWRMQREGCGVALLTLQTSPEHWRRFTTHFDSEGTAAPLRTLTKLGDSESKMSGLVDVGLVIDLDRSRPGAIALLNTWDEHYRNPARRYSVASLAALQVPRSKMELYGVTAPASSQPKAPFDLPDLTDRLVCISASQATFENRLVTMINHKLDATMAQRLRGHPHALRVLGYASVDDNDGTRWLVTERVDVWACDTTEGEVSSEERLRMLMHVAAAWEKLTEAGQRPPTRNLDSSMVAGIGSMWKLAPFEVSATQEDAAAGADGAEMPYGPEELLACSHHDFLQRFAAYGRALVTDDVRTCLASRLQLRRNVKARKRVDEALVNAGGVMDRVADHIASVVTALYRRVLLQTTVEDTLWMENIEESISNTAAKLDSFAARLRDVADGFVEPPLLARSAMGRTARWQREDVEVPDWSPCATSLTMKSCPETPDAWPCLARMTCESGQTSPQAMAAAFGAEGLSAASRWQLRPSLWFDYEHGDTKQTTTEDIIGLERIPTLEVVRLSGTSVTDVRHLASASMLRQLRLHFTKVTTDGTQGLERISTLETLGLRGTLVTDVRHLASAKALKHLDLYFMKVTTEGTMGLERMPTLKSLCLGSTSVTDVRHLSSAKALKQLDVSGTKVTTEGTMGLEGIPTLEELRLRSTSVTDVRHLASAKALKLLFLSGTKVTTEGTMGLENIPTLEDLDLGSTSVAVVQHLASAKALKQLDLCGTEVTTEGTMGLERIPTLETLLLRSTSVTDVRHLVSAKALKHLNLSGTTVTMKSTKELEDISTLEKLDLSGTLVTDVRHLAWSTKLKLLNLRNTTVTTEGTMGLECIPTLERLDLSSTWITDVRHLASAKALKQLDLSGTQVKTESTMGLECIPTLEDLDLSSTSVSDIRHLASSKKLRLLNLRSTKVTTAGTMGLESIPTLERLDLSRTPIANVRHLASAKALTWLCLVHTKVATEDTVGLERAVEAGSHRGIRGSGPPMATSQIDGEDSVDVRQRGAYKRSSFVESYENIPFGSVFASGGSAQIRSVAGRPDILAKIYHHHVLSNAEGYQRETDILQSLRHDYIVSIRSIIKDDDVMRGYLMEAMDGNLVNAILTPEQRLVALRQCAEGLSYAHSRDITHGDVKPENCLVRVRNGVVTAKVCDFGMARVLSTMASTTIHGGTVLYIAPEGNTHPKAADVFAFGLTMWMVLSAGHDHGLGNSIADVMRGMAEGRRPPLGIPSLQALPSSDSVCELLQQCWAAAPTRRPTMAEVMLELQNILRSVPLAVSTPEPPVPATSSLTWSRSQRYRVSSPLAADHDLFQRVASLLHRDASLSRCCVRRVQLVQHDDRDVFWRIHRAEAASLKRSQLLRVSPPNSNAAKTACVVLDAFATKAARHLQTLVNDPAHDSNNGLSRIVFAWHGTPEERLDAVCRDGLRVLRGRDGGYFGEGVYLAMEADYARRYAGETLCDAQLPTCNAYPVRVLHFPSLPCHARGRLQTSHRGYESGECVRTPSRAAQCASGRALRRRAAAPALAVLRRHRASTAAVQLARSARRRRAVPVPLTVHAGPCVGGSLQRQFRSARRAAVHHGGGREALHNWTTIVQPGRVVLPAPRRRHPYARAVRCISRGQEEEGRCEEAERFQGRDAMSRRGKRRRDAHSGELAAGG